MCKRFSILTNSVHTCWTYFVELLMFYLNFMSVSCNSITWLGVLFLLQYYQEEVDESDLIASVCNSQYSGIGTIDFAKAQPRILGVNNSVRVFDIGLILEYLIAASLMFQGCEWKQQTAGDDQMLVSIASFVLCIVLCHCCVLCRCHCCTLLPELTSPASSREREYLTY